MSWKVLGTFCLIFGAVSLPVGVIAGNTTLITLGPLLLIMGIWDFHLANN